MCLSIYLYPGYFYDAMLALRIEMDEWTSDWMVERMSEWVHEFVTEFMNELIILSINPLLNEWTNESM